MKAAIVLRTGGEFTVKHAASLVFQLSLHLDAEVLAFSDVPVPGAAHVPLKYSWPGWWAVIELLRPDVLGDLLYFDLDTVIRGDLDEIAAVKDLTLLRDFYRDGTRRPEGLGSGVMRLPEAARADAWSRWQPRLIQQYRNRGVGPQAFLEDLWLGKAYRWQDRVPGQVVSFKVHCRQHGVPPDARVICYHGRPRPWTLEGQLR